MSAVCKLLSLAALGAIALTGCYDLSDPSGPHRDDFARDRAATQPQDDTETKADAVCGKDPCTAEERRAARLLELVEATGDDDTATDATRRKAVLVAPGAP